MATEDQIDQAIERLDDALDAVRTKVAGDEEHREAVVRAAVFVIAVKILGGREGLAQAALTCGEAQ